MNIRKVIFNNRRRSFELLISRRRFSYPYFKCNPIPGPGDRVVAAAVDYELGGEGFTYRLESGTEGTVHMEQVLDYNRDPAYLRDLFLHKITIEAIRRVKESPLSKREITRRLGTSAAQFYRLIDPTNYRKSLGQLVTLLYLLDCELDLVIRQSIQPLDSSGRLAAKGS
jgi:hypothetical protein